MMWEAGVCMLVTQSCLTFATPWTVARQAPLSIEFSRQEYWSGLPFSSAVRGRCRLKFVPAFLQFASSFSRLLVPLTFSNFRFPTGYRVYTLPGASLSYRRCCQSWIIYLKKLPPQLTSFFSFYLIKHSLSPLEFKRIWHGNRGE